LQKVDRIKHNLLLLSNQATNNIETILGNGIDNEQKEISDLKELSEWKFILVSCHNLLILAAELEFIYGQGSLSKDYSEDIVKTVEERYSAIDEKFEEYFGLISEKFKLSDRKSEKRLMKNEHFLEKVDVNLGLPLLRFKVGEVNVSKRVQKLAQKVKNAADERLDYGLNFGMSDKRIYEEIVKPMEYLSQLEPISSNIKELQESLSSDAHILFDNEGKPYYLKEIASHDRYFKRSP
jgi:hypothetical protein